MPKQSINFRGPAKVLTEDETALVKEVRWVLSANRADPLVVSEISTRNLLTLLPSEMPGKRELIRLAHRGLFKDCARQSDEVVMRYGRPMRPWLWYSPGTLPSQDESEQCQAVAGERVNAMDAQARLESLAKAVSLARKESNTLVAAQMVSLAISEAIEGMTDD